MVPIAEQNKDYGDREIKMVDFDAQNPYTDVVKPFAVFNETLAKGPQTDQSYLNLWAKAFINSISKAAEPFVAPSMWVETVRELWPNDAGISKSKAGGTIVDWKNDVNPWEKAMYHLYSKLFPTTSLISIPKALNLSFNGSIGLTSSVFPVICNLFLSMMIIKLSNLYLLAE